MDRMLCAINALEHDIAQMAFLPKLSQLIHQAFLMTRQLAMTELHSRQNRSERRWPLGLSLGARLVPVGNLRIQSLSRDDEMMGRALQSF